VYFYAEEVFPSSEVEERKQEEEASESEGKDSNSFITFKASIFNS